MFQVYSESVSKLIMKYTSSTLWTFFWNEFVHLFWLRSILEVDVLNLLSNLEVYLIKVCFLKWCIYLGGKIIYLSSKTTLDLYFMIQVKVFTNHILAKNIYLTNHREWTDHKNISLKPANKYQIIWQHHISSNILIADFDNHLFLCWAKVLWTIFYRPINNKQRWDNYLLLLWCQKSIS